MALQYIYISEKQEEVAAGIWVYLAHRDPADAGVQHSSDWISTHFTHKRELLPPSDTVLLHLLPDHAHTHTHMKVDASCKFIKLKKYIYVKKKLRLCIDTVAPTCTCSSSVCHLVSKSNNEWSLCVWFTYGVRWWFTVYLQCEGVEVDYRLSKHGDYYYQSFLIQHNYTALHVEALNMNLFYECETARSSDYFSKSQKIVSHPHFFKAGQSVPP